jgi:hypothetical protein
LNPPPAQKANLSPHFGFAWATHDGKTVIRGGAGRYFDPIFVDLASTVNERHALSPAGTGRRSNIPGSSIVDEGRALDFNQRATSFTAGDLLAILPGIRADLERQLDPDNRDFTFRNLDLNKTGLGLSDPSYEAPYALHFNLGVQRELAEDLVVSSDFALRRFLHTPLFGIDYNRFNRPQGPVIPRCTGTQRNHLTRPVRMAPLHLTAPLESRLTRGCSYASKSASLEACSFWLRMRWPATRAPSGPAVPTARLGLQH